jgi:hypothetical protein
MTGNRLWRLAGLAVRAIFSKSVAPTAGEITGTDPRFLSDDRMLHSPVDEVRGGQARSDMGKGQSRFIPLGVRKAKGSPERKKGDPVEITINDHNLPGDVQWSGEGSEHRVIVGQLAGPMETGHDNAVIRTMGGKESSHLVRPFARNKVASMPVGVDAIFLIDESHKIVDMAIVSVGSVQRAAALQQ